MNGIFDNLIGGCPCVPARRDDCIGAGAQKMDEGRYGSSCDKAGPAFDMRCQLTEC